MFFVLSKTLALLLVPSNALVLIGLLGLVLLPTRLKRAGTRLVIASFVLLLLVGISPLGNLLIGPLENRFPVWRESGGTPPHGIIVLGGMIDADMTAARGPVSLTDAAERVTVVADLARRYPQARILFTGGDPGLTPSGNPEADAALPLLESFGIPRARVVLENRSRNTAENAVFSKELVAPKSGERWLVVTSAMHMPRAIGAFRRAGFPVEAYPVDFRTTGTAKDVLALPRGFLAGLGQLDAAFHEWVGLAAYWLTGRSPELLPGP